MRSDTVPLRSDLVGPRHNNSFVSSQRMSSVFSPATTPQTNPNRPQDISRSLVLFLHAAPAVAVHTDRHVRKDRRCFQERSDHSSPQAGLRPYDEMLRQKAYNFNATPASSRRQTSSLHEIERPLTAALRAMAELGVS